MAGSNRRREHSLETILTFENRDVYGSQSQWSVVWSTANVPGMDNATGAGGRRVSGRRRLRMGSLALSALLTMHCRVSASLLTGGFFFFMMCLIAAIVLLANPLRHFEVYLGQWSISGPGRAFRILPMLDGIGIAMCINAIIRAISCCAIAAISMVYLIHSVADARLPFTYCRDFELKSYEPELKYVTSLRTLQGTRLLMDTDYIFKEEQSVISLSTTVGLEYTAWRNASYIRDRNIMDNRIGYADSPRQIEVCKETYTGVYPPLYRTPAYNFFYVEVVRLRSDYSLKRFNLSLLACIILMWLILWVFIVIERMKYGRLIWNNMPAWIMMIPWAWAAVLFITAASNLTSFTKTLTKLIQINPVDIAGGIADALEVALYIHSASVGTELIYGKGLNHYASGHIDPELNNENVWHSGNLLLLTALHSGGAALCGLVDYTRSNTTGAYKIYESTLWVIPMYSKCTSLCGYSHFVSALIFGGLVFSYITTAFLLLKTALHTIFEYRVKLVFLEQAVVASLILSCMILSVFFATNGGLPLLETVDAIMTGIAMPFICALELAGLLYVYRSHDFISDLNISTEESTWPSRIGIQWQIIPVVTLVTLIMKASMFAYAEMPGRFMYIALAPLLAVIVAVPLRACHNAYTFLRPAPRHGT